MPCVMRIHEQKHISGLLKHGGRKGAWCGTQSSLRIVSMRALSRDPRRQSNGNIRSACDSDLGQHQYHMRGHEVVISLNVWLWAVGCGITI